MNIVSYSFKIGHPHEERARIEGKGRNFLNNGLFCISDFYKTMS